MPARLSTLWLRIVLAGVLIGQPASVLAQASAGCSTGQRPSLVLGFATLKDQLGDTMGEPLECEQVNPRTGLLQLRTTTGLATYSKLLNVPMFENETSRWAFVSGQLVTWSIGSPPPAVLRSSEAQARLEQAVQIQAQSRAHLGVLGDAFTCQEARFASFRRSDVEPQYVDQWYVASQLWADADLIATTGAGQPASAELFLHPPATWNEVDARCYVDRGFIFLDRLWNYESGGYYARANPTGIQVERGPRYADDNSLAGLALLATLHTLADASLKQRYLHAAVREADFLIQSELWDSTFGGGFWWNTNRGDTREGKPAQSNALAALFFARLYAATGIETYREWSLRTLLWMDTILFDPVHQLYTWSVSYQNLQQRSGATVNLGEYFNYDQAIAIEAQLLAAARLDGDPNRRTRARSVGDAVQREFWNPEGGGYNLEAGNPQVWSAYGAWTSIGHLALYDLTRDLRYLDWARANADVLTATFGQPDGGVGYRWCVCLAEMVDRRRDTAAQAWMQHLQTALAARVQLDRAQS